MSAAAQRPLNWNVLGVNAKNLAERRAEARGRHLRPRARRPRGRAHRADELPGVPVVPLRLRARRDARVGRRHGPPARREARVLRRRRRAGEARRAVAERQEPDAHARQLGQPHASTTWSRPRTSSTGAGWSARSPRRRAASPWEVLATIARADELNTSFGTVPAPETDDDWKARIQVWRDRRALIGASDAGAHLDLLASFNYATEVLGKAVRQRKLLPLEEAINLITDTPAQLYGLTRARPGRRGVEGRRRRARPRDRSAATTCACAWTSPAAPVGSTPRPTASTTCSSTARPSSATASSPTAAQRHAAPRRPRHRTAPLDEVRHPERLTVRMPGGRPRDVQAGVGEPRARR